MLTIAPHTTQIDLEYLGHPQAIASCLLESGSDLALVDPGPSTSLPALRRKLTSRGIDIGNLSALLLTHIHLDHAGATGTLVKENPRLRVYVQERGARHMVAPGKLLESATRLYGGAMDYLWGEFLAVPAENITALRGGEHVRFGTRSLKVLYTPGHASHHVTYIDAETGIAFVGDTGGMRISGSPCVVPLTPPPDVDVESWERSMDLILAQEPEQLFVTHFGPAERPAEHLAELREKLFAWSEIVRKSLEAEGSDADRSAQFAKDMAAELQTKLPYEEAARYAKGSGLEQCWSGLARYWRKRV